MYPRILCFPSCKRRVVEAHFQWGGIISNGGVLSLRGADRRLGLLTLFGVGENADKGFGQLTGYRPEDR